MSTYTPDCWAIVEIVTPKDKFYKVLASWSGSYLYGSSWKLSSGNEGLTYEDGVYTVPQSSGSEYVLHETNEGMSIMMAQVFESTVKSFADKPEYSFKVVEMSAYKKVLGL